MPGRTSEPLPSQPATHYYSLDNYTPEIVSHFDTGLVRRTIWRVQNRDGSYGTFTSWWWFGHLQYYTGTAKCDGTESHKAGRIVMLDTPEELWAFRWRAAGPGPLKWDNMGGS